MNPLKDLAEEKPYRLAAQTQKTTKYPLGFWCGEGEKEQA